MVMGMDAIIRYKLDGRASMTDWLNGRSTKICTLFRLRLRNRAKKAAGSSAKATQHTSRRDTCSGSYGVDGCQVTAKRDKECGTTVMGEIQ